MRRAFVAFPVLLLLLSGCGRVTYPDLPESAIAFEMGAFVDTAEDNAAYGTLEYEGRTYIGYGTLGRT